MARCRSRLSTSSRACSFVREWSGRRRDEAAVLDTRRRAPENLADRHADAVFSHLLVPSSHLAPARPIIVREALVTQLSEVRRLLSRGRGRLGCIPMREGHDVVRAVPGSHPEGAKRSTRLTVLLIVLCSAQLIL